MAKEDGEIEELGKKLAQNPDSMVFVQLADACRRAGDLARSVDVCLAGLQRHPTYTTARVILGRNYLDLKKTDEAAAEFRRIEAMDSENIVAHRMLGQIALLQGRYAEAIARQQRVLALDPDDSTAQELLQQALLGAKQNDAPSPAPRDEPEPAAPALNEDLTQGLKVADIYLKKKAYLQAAEVLKDLLASAPGQPDVRRKLDEVEAEAKKRAEEEARKRAEEEARKRAEEEARKRAEEEARKRAEEEARKRAEEEARKRAEEEARKRAEEEARKRAEEEAKKRAEEEAKKRAEEEAKKRAEEEAKKRAEEEAKKRAEEEAKKRAEEEAKKRVDGRVSGQDRQGHKISAEDILAVMAPSAEDLIENDTPAGSATRAGGGALEPRVRKAIDEFLAKQSIESSLLLDPRGGLLESRMAGDPSVLVPAAAAVFQSTQKAARNAGFGETTQIVVSGEDGRHLVLLALGPGVLVAVTGRDANLGLLRVAAHDLIKRI